MIAASNTGHLTRSCPFFQPAVQSECSAIAAKLPSVSVKEALSLAYIAIKGTQALVGTIGTECESEAQPRCITNRDPAKFFSSGHSFASLWRASVASEASPVHMYSLTTCVKVGSQWYVYQPPSAF